MSFPDSLPDMPASRAKNRRPYGREYPVSKIEGNFLTIQSAIDAAVADGFGATTPALVVVYPGVYTEDITLVSGIDVRSAGPFEDRAIPIGDQTVIAGSVTYTTATSTVDEVVIMEGISVKAVGKDAIVFSGTLQQKLNLRNMSISVSNFDGGTARALTMTASAGSSFVILQNCVLFQSGLSPTSVTPTVGVDDGALLAFETQIRAIDSAALAIHAGGGPGATAGGIFLSDHCNLTGRWEQLATNDESHTIERCIFETSGAACITVGSAGSVVVNETTLNRSDAGPCISGTIDVDAILSWADLTFTGLGYGFLVGLPHNQLSEVPANRNVERPVYATPGAAGISDVKANEIVRIDMTTVAASLSIRLPGVALVPGGSGAAIDALRGTVVEIKEVSGTAGVTLSDPMTVDGFGGDLIDGLASFSFTYHRQCVRFMSTGAGWVVCPTESGYGYTQTGAEAEVNSGGAPVAQPALFLLAPNVMGPDAITSGTPPGPVVRSPISGPLPRSIVLKRVSLSTIVPGGLVESIGVTLAIGPTAFTVVLGPTVGPLPLDLGTGLPTDYDFDLVLTKGSHYGFVVGSPGPGYTGSIPAGTTFEVHWEIEFEDLGGV